MKSIKINLESDLYLLALLLAGAIRFSGLGAAALSDTEAALALQALQTAQGEAAVLTGSHPLYLVLTTAGMFLMEANNLITRFWPAIAGSLVVLTPWFFRRPLGRLTAVLLAFFLAIDPGLAAASRQAGSPTLAAAGILFAAGFWLNGRPALAGICAGLAVLGGPGVWQGLLGLGLAGWAYTFLLARKTKDLDGPAGEDLQVSTAISGEPGSARTAGWFALGTLLFVGSLFLFIPAGWSAAGQSLVTYVQTWTQPTGVPVLQVLQALLLYSFLAVIAGLSSVALFWEARVVRFLAAWLFGTLLLALVPPGRQVSGLVWVLLPLWALAAVLVEKLFVRPVAERLPTLGQAILGTVILAFVSMSVVGISGDLAAGRLQSADWLALAAALILLALSTLLVGWGWGWRVAGYGLTWSLALVLLIFTLMSTWNASGLSGRRQAELWADGPVFRDSALIRQTIEDLSLWKIGARDRLQVVVVGIPSPALQWTLRGQDRISFSDSLAASASPEFVITADAGEPGLSAGYRGQDFLLAESPVWNISGPQAWFRWLIFREIPTESRSIVLWARTDLFPGAQAQSQDAPEPLPVLPVEPRQ